MIVQLTNQHLMGLVMNIMKYEWIQIMLIIKRFVVHIKKLLRIRFWMSLIKRWTKNDCQGFCIQKSGALSIPMCLQKLNLMMILNDRLRWYLITHKCILPPNKTSVRYLSMINFMGEWWIGLSFWVCFPSDLIFLFLLSLFYFFYIFLLLLY